MEDKKFWMDIGVKLGRSLECSQKVEQKLNKFIDNEHKHMAEKVDIIDEKVNKIAVKVAWIAGAFFVLTIVVNILIRIL